MSNVPAMKSRTTQGFTLTSTTRMNFAFLLAAEEETPILQIQSSYTVVAKD
jgi:hypothetical protein